MYDLEERKHKSNTQIQLSASGEKQQKSIFPGLPAYGGISGTYNLQRELPSTQVVQLCLCEEAATIKRLCWRHGFEIGDDDANVYWERIQNGEWPMIQGHNAYIRPWGNGFHIIKTKIRGGLGPMGRTADNGASAKVDHELPDFVLLSQYQMQATVDGETLNSVGPRSNLNSVMGESAQEQTDIENSEYLHMIAHSLGGQDVAENLLPGYHALNTAMIPIEYFVSELARRGLEVDYKVSFCPRVGAVIWVSEVILEVKFDYYNLHASYVWRISLDDPGFLNNDNFEELKEDVKQKLEEVDRDMGAEYILAEDGFFN